MMKAVSFGRNPLMYRVMDNLKDDVLVSVSCKDALDLIADNFTYKLNVRLMSKFFITLSMSSASSKKQVSSLD